MKADERSKFKSWYDKQTDKTFNMKNELIEYCTQDVRILLMGTMCFMNLFIESTNINPYSTSITLSSAVMKGFRTCYLNDVEISLPPPLGYDPRRNRSYIANAWLSWQEKKLGKKIDREVFLGRYTADGYIADDRHVFEFFGCFWHGCQTCSPTFNITKMNNIIGKTFSQLNAETIEKLAYYARHNYTVTHVWECQLKTEMKRDEEQRKFINDTKLMSKYRKPINLNDAYCGGRVEVINKFMKSSGDTKINYYDVTSLYPFVLSSRDYPIGQPTVYICDFPINYLSLHGVIHCKIIPPRRLFFPLLPFKKDGKLLFSLCLTCSHLNQQHCDHTDEERSMTSTWCLPEVAKAVELKYEISEIYEMWIYKDTIPGQTNPFKEYVNLFLKYKMEASGYPREDMTETEKDEYINHIATDQGIFLRKEKVSKRPGMRLTSKIAVNSFYGKFGEKDPKSKTVYEDSPDHVNKLLSNQEVEVEDIEFITEDTVMVKYRELREYSNPPAHASIIIAAYTTSYGRLHLYTYLEKLGDRVAYLDTDSVITTCKEGEYKPELSNDIGGMTDELSEFGKGAYITKIIAIGCKSYILLITNDAGENFQIIKFKGLTLSLETEKTVNYKSVKELLRNEDLSYSVPQKRFKANKEMELETQEFSKILRFTFDKRASHEEFGTLPFGY